DEGEHERGECAADPGRSPRANASVGAVRCSGTGVPSRSSHGKHLFPLSYGRARRRIPRNAAGGAVALAAERLGPVHDVRRDEDEELPPGIRRAAPLEEDADDGNVPEERDLVEVPARVAGVDAAD